MPFCWNFNILKACRRLCGRLWSSTWISLRFQLICSCRWIKHPNVRIWVNPMLNKIPDTVLPTHFLSVSQHDFILWISIGQFKEWKQNSELTTFFHHKQKNVDPKMFVWEVCCLQLGKLAAVIPQQHHFPETSRVDHLTSRRRKVCHRLTKTTVENKSSHPATGQTALKDRNKQLLFSCWCLWLRLQTNKKTPSGSVCTRSVRMLLQAGVGAAAPQRDRKITLSHRKEKIHRNHPCCCLITAHTHTQTHMHTETDIHTHTHTHRWEASLVFCFCFSSEWSAETLYLREETKTQT